MIASAPPQVPVRASLIGHCRGWPAPFPPAPPQPQILGLEEAQRRRGAAWAPQRPPPPPPPAPPLPPLPGLWARRGAGRRRQTAGTGWRRPGGHRGRGGRGPRKGRSPSRAMLRGAVNGASPSPAVAARASSSSSACSLEGRGDPGRGAAPRPLSPSATGEKSRSLRAPPRPVPFPQPSSRARPGAPRVRESRGGPAPRGREGLSRCGGGAALSRAAPLRAHKQAAVPPLARRSRHQKPTPGRLVLFGGTRAKGARGYRPVFPTERLPSPPRAGRAAAALPPPGPLGLRGPRTARSGGGRCGGAVAAAWPCKAGRRQRSERRSLRGSAAGRRCLPRAGARGRREGNREERCCRRSK
ncbi:basic proline-rich protein-like [Pyrgilauda ruficollis]|uniref:basic proline-rich protein-like n=1 Tax=Pyrgilauda ruficollis TaxID=221976 RepID=UPI001B87C6CA|nr:basic proline-rich protein-like [Pyrgilauda ruficollis]